ncbi:MAG: cation transporter [Lachnospiraceae bacterium]|nr:cation transporter [Lachnospiraceae bacterium]
MKKASIDKTELFAKTPVPAALLTMAVPTIISQVINLIYNMVDAFFIGRTGNSYMMAATTITLTIMLMNISFANLFGIGGGSHVARLMGAGKTEYAGRVSAFSVWATILVALLYSLFIGLFMRPVLTFLGASEYTMDYARSYTTFVVVIGTLPTLFSMVLAHLLRNTGYSAQASIGLSGGGILNMFLDPLFMFVLLPKGMEVTGAAIATLLSNSIACIYLIIAYIKASREAPLSLRLRDALQIDGENVRAVLRVGIPSAVLTGLFDVANMCVNIIAASHNDMALAAVGIAMKVERLPNAINVGICQGMLPIVAFNYSSGNHVRMREVISTARRYGLMISACCLVLFEIFAVGLAKVFMSTTAGDTATALVTVAYAALFLRVRCLGSPVQFMNYHASYCMQAMGNGRGTLIHAFVRELVFYIPFMFLFDRLFGEVGLVAALPVGEACSAVVAFFLLHRTIEAAKERHDI